MQFAGRQRIVGPREVIEPDRHVAGLFQQPPGTPGLAITLLRSRQGGGIDQLLVDKAVRHVSIAEQCHAGRPQFDRLRDGAGDAVARLVRQAVDEVDVNVVDPRPAQAIDDGLRLFERLDAVDRDLDRLVEVLDADRGPIDAGGRKRLDLVSAERAGIDLDGELCFGLDVEVATQGGAERDDVLGRKAVGRATTPVDVRHR